MVCRLQSVKQEASIRYHELRRRSSGNTALFFVAAVTLSLALSPLALRAPAAGVDKLVGQLQTGSSSSLSQEVSAQTLRVIFASQPWARAQIADQRDSIPFQQLLDSSSAKLVEQSACLLADLAVYNQTTDLPQQKLAATLARQTCTPACQKCLIQLLSSQSTVADTVLGGTALHRTLQWAGILPFDDMAALRLLTSDAATAAAALAVNQAASPQGECVATLCLTWPGFTSSDPLLAAPPAATTETSYPIFCRA